MYLGLNSGPHNPHIGALQLSFLEIQNLRIKKGTYIFVDSFLGYMTVLLHIYLLIKISQHCQHIPSTFAH